MMSEESKTILLVDDDIDLAESLRDVLVQEGYVVIRRENGREALEYLKSAKPSLIILDGTMPVLDGFQTLREIRAQAEFSELPVVLMSAEEPRGERTAYGWSEYVRKPVDLDWFTELLERLLTTTA